MAIPKNDEVITMDIDEVLKDSGIDYQVLKQSEDNEGKVSKEESND